MLSQRLQTKPYAMLSERFQATLHKKMSYVMLSYSWDNIAQVKTLMQCCISGCRKLCSRKKPVIALIVLGQHCIVKNPMQYCLRGSRQHVIKKFLCKFTLTLLTTLHKKKSNAMLSKYSWVNIAQLKTLCNFVRESPDNIALKKSCAILP